MKAYLISGIGADQRMFHHLRLPDFYQVEYVQWNIPFPDESLSAYASRLFLNREVSQPFVLIGISFGGLVAVELAKKFNASATIIISSISLANQLPRYYQLAGRLRINEFLPAYVFKWMTAMKQQLLMKTDADRKLIRSVIRDGDNLFIKWGLNAVLKWTNTVTPPNLFHIHGSSDAVFPINLTNPTHRVKGGHMLILNEAEEINDIMGKILTT